MTKKKGSYFDKHMGVWVAESAIDEHVTSRVPLRINEVCEAAAKLDENREEIVGNGNDMTGDFFKVTKKPLQP